MKKQFQILATTFITVAFISCSKEKIEMTEMASTTSEEIAASSSSNRPYIDPLTIGLEARFEFNGNLKSQIRGVADGVPSRRVPSYGADRKGNFKSSLYLDGAYSVKLKGVPQQTNTSLSVWIKPKYLVNAYGSIVTSDLRGPRVYQQLDQLKGTMATDVSTPGIDASFYNTGWQHVVLTFDGAFFKMYLNNVLVEAKPYTASITPKLYDYFLGWDDTWPSVFWNGYVDDLRFYSRTLSASDVQKLYNL
jgi:hypothetical protein